MIMKHPSECIEACIHCARVCEACENHCIMNGDRPDCARMCRDSAKICFLAASFMASSSMFSDMLCELCAKICRECAKECMKHDNPHCQTCGKVCEDCAAVVDKMILVAAD